MSVGFALFNAYHPGRVFIGPESEFPKKTKAEKREEKRQKKEEKQRKKEEKKDNRSGILARSDDQIELVNRVGGHV